MMERKVPHKDPEVKKKYHKEYNRKWEKKANRWADPKRRAYCKSLYDSKKAVAALRQHLYGVTAEDYERLKRKQKNRCAICGQKERRIHYKTKKRQSLSVDHDHITGLVRGLLCRDCNFALGLFQHSLKLLLKAIKYLKVS